MSLLSLDVGGTSFQVSWIEGRTALSKLFSFHVRASVADALPAAAELLGEACTLGMMDDFDRALTVRGIVTALERDARATGGGGLVLTLEPEVAKLAVGRNSRVFQEMTAVDIIKKVLDTAGVGGANVRWEARGEYPTRPYCAQYRESDWAFIERLLAEEGIYYWFEHRDEATVLVFADDSSAAPELEEGAEIPYHDDDGLNAVRDAVFRVGRRFRITPEAVRLRDYNFDKPRLSLDAKAGSGRLEIYDFPGRFAVPDEGDRRAQTALEALRATRAVIFGETGSTRLRAGLAFELTDHSVEALNGRYLVESVDYNSVQRSGGDAAQVGLGLRWTAIPLGTPYRPARGRITQATGGPQTGVVVGAPGEEVHPDRSGRIRVQHYWDREGQRDDKASTWMRVGQFALGGSMIIPRVGWEVLVDHHEGDVDQPFVATHLYDGQYPVPYALPANKTRTAWQTATTPGGGSANEIRLEDRAGSEEIFIHASRDMDVVVGDNRTEVVGVNLTQTVGSNRDVKVGSNLKVGIKSNQDVSIGGSESLTVSGGRVVSVGGSESATIGGSRSATVANGVNLEAKGGRTLAVGGSMMAASALTVDRSVLGTLSVSVGGSWISAAAAGVSNATGGACAETVGGAKIQAGAAGCKTSVKGAAAETVGGAYVIAAGGNAGEAATGSLSFTVGGAFLGNAPSIEIEARSEISIRCGAASVTIKGGSVEVKAPSLLSPGATIKKKASTIKHN